jgi:hypothetical protein
MDKHVEPLSQIPEKKREQSETAKKLARPPKDKREVTIGPTTSTGPDITVR